MNASIAYELFVGQITVEEFVAPFNGSVEKAVTHLMTEKLWEDDPSETLAPSNLADLITKYCELNLTEKNQK